MCIFLSELRSKEKKTKFKKMPAGKMGALTFEGFLTVEIVYLLRNVRILSDGLDFEPCSTYLAHSIEALKRKWCDDYMDYDYVIDSLRTHNKQFIDLDQFSSVMQFTDVQKLYIMYELHKKQVTFVIFRFLVKMFYSKAKYTNSLFSITYFFQFWNLEKQQ